MRLSWEGRAANGDTLSRNSKRILVLTGSVAQLVSFSVGVSGILTFRRGKSISSKSKKQHNMQPDSMTRMRQVIGISNATNMRNREQLLF